MSQPPCPICGRPVMRSKAITCTAICASKRQVAIVQGKRDGKPVAKPVVVVIKMSPLQIERDAQRIRKNAQDREKWHERRRFLEQGAVLFARRTP